MSKLARTTGGLMALTGIAALAACGGGSSSSSASGSGSSAAADSVSATTGGSSSATGSSAASGGTTNLVMWWWGDQEAAGLKGYLDQSVALYEKAHPEIQISTVLQSTDNLVPAFTAAAQAKKGPDIQYFWGGIYSMEPYWSGSTTPIQDLVGPEEVKHYINSSEDTFDGKVVTAGWYIQPSFPLLVRKDVLAQAGISSAPTTWNDLIADCKTLRAKGITPIAGGIKDGWFGGWLYSIFGSQTLSANDVKKAVTGDASFSDPNQAAWWSKLQESVQAKCWNDDIGSVDLYQGQQTWSDGKAAMTITAGTDVCKFLKAVGPDKVEVAALPAFGTGPGANKLGSTSQTLGVTSFSKHQKEAAAFIMFLHTPDRLNAFYAATGAFPADDRFSTASIADPQLAKLYKLATSGAPYLENFMPSELDAKSNFAFSQLIFSGSLTPEKAAAQTQALAERLRTTQPDEIANFKKWSAQ